ncbi:Cd dCMP deaminase [Vibrio phage henriette 12B8]|uniref:dCMP deaminase n=1 Tax=Vibrio phage henriette 12B8 TaxID=573174 RepID=UPI0002C045C1|nr:dCMP deaminase [Vibrio phage henriette 12B8]AGG58207.1 Cd dCMP deaminase [Vibrio phage henriette 12B8]
MCNIHQIRIQQAFIEAKMSKCVKAKVGCILVDNEGRIAGSGYNGTRKGEQNCCDRFPDYEQSISTITDQIGDMCIETAELSGQPLAGMRLNIKLANQALEDLKKEHRDWASEHEIHAEMNVLLSSDRSDYFGGTLYVTHKPCKRCAPVIAASGLIEVVYSIDGLTGDSDDSIFGNVKLTQVGEA